MTKKITDAGQLADLFGEPSRVVKEAFCEHLEAKTRRFISLSPLVFIASGNAAGELDLSPKGGEPGFVRIRNDRTLLIPDSKGNNKVHGFRNMLQNPNIGLTFVIPGIDDVLRIRGRVSLLYGRDALTGSEIAGDDIKRDDIKGEDIKIVMEIAIQTVFPHCGKAFKVADIWNPETHLDAKGSNVPLVGQMAVALAEASKADLENV